MEWNYDICCILLDVAFVVMMFIFMFYTMYDEWPHQCVHEKIIVRKFAQNTEKWRTFSLTPREAAEILYVTENISRIFIPTKIERIVKGINKNLTEKHYIYLFNLAKAFKNEKLPNAEKFTRLGHNEKVVSRVLKEKND